MKKLVISVLILLATTTCTYGQTGKELDIVLKNTQQVQTVKAKIKRIPTNNIKATKMNVGLKALGFKVKARKKLAQKL